MAADQVMQYSQLPDAAWAKLVQAANDPTQMLRLMAVGTVTPEGKPSNRTLVLRGADQESGMIWFHTDKRSPKVNHLSRVPYVSAIGYDANERIQIRIEGGVTLHHDDELARRHWEQASLVVRHAYGLPVGPGQPLSHHDPRAQTMRTQHSQGEEDRARENFVVVQVEVDSLDWLQIGVSGQLRALMRRDQNWQPKPLVP